ncbi:hypothetical protein JYU15_00950 [bacterium AH-315-I18]|nr:hypothetical protein [bacterium AH-315-I18]
MRLVLSLFFVLILITTLPAAEHKIGGRKNIEIASKTIVSTDFSKLKKVWRSTAGVEIKPYNVSEKYREINYPTGKWAFFYNRIPYQENFSKNQYVALNYKVKNNNPKSQFALQTVFMTKV